jgi:hypothetical protein
MDALFFSQLEDTLMKFLIQLGAVLFGVVLLCGLFQFIKPEWVPSWVPYAAAAIVVALIASQMERSSNAASRKSQQDDFTRGVHAALDKLEETDPEARRKLGRVKVVHQEQGDG